MTVSAWSQWYRRSERGRPAPPAVARSAGGVTLRGLDAWGCGGERGGRGGQGGGRGVVDDRVEGDQLDVHRRVDGPVQMPPVAAGGALDAHMRVGRVGDHRDGD